MSALPDTRFTTNIAMNATYRLAGVAFARRLPWPLSPIVQAPRRPSLVNVILYGAKPAAEIPNAFDAWEDMPGYRTR